MFALSLVWWGLVEDSYQDWQSYLNPSHLPLNALNPGRWNGLKIEWMPSCRFVRVYVSSVHYAFLAGQKNLYYTVMYVTDE